MDYADARLRTMRGTFRSEIIEWRNLRQPPRFMLPIRRQIRQRINSLHDIAARAQANNSMIGLPTPSRVT